MLLFYLFRSFYIYEETALHFAVQEGHIPTVNLLLDAGANPNAKNCDGETPIFSAIRWGQPELISVLSQRGCCINGTNNKGHTPLAVAANFQSPGLVTALIESGATKEVSGVDQTEIDFLTTSRFQRTNSIELLNKPMTANSKNRTSTKVRNPDEEEASVLFDMIANNQAEQLEEELGKGINVNSTAKFTNETLLHAAVAYGASECVTLLLKSGALVNAKTAYYQDTPLHIAIQEGFFDIFHSLIRAGADIEAENCEGEGPLFTAVKYNRVEMFRILIRKGANVNKANYDNLPPIHFAVLDNNEFLTDSLLYHGADPANGKFNPYLFAFNNESRDIAEHIQIASPVLAKATKLPTDIFSIIKGDEVSSLKKLITKGFDLNLIDVLEGSPLHCAVENGSFECVKLLVERGANINVRSIQRNETPLQIAIRRGNKEIYDYIREQPVDVNLRNKEGETALFYAVRQKDPQVVEDMIKLGSQINDMNEVGLTPLYIAVSLKATDIAKILLDNKADPNVEVHQSVKLAQEMEYKEFNDVILTRTLDNREYSSRLARNDAKKLRQTRGNTPLSKIRARCVIPEEEPPQEEHIEGMCYICNRNKATQKLIPCGCVVSCRGCIKNFIEEHPPCPCCHLSFYATASTE